ncbi:hypothetical protein QYE76_047102 [Lolium multiflorum]|uniref:Uncharacterized protein n=1 Tax=Lolium multiflorum TaxID=4521 RepID=A0AAD8WZU9_LOLMU|nr:hypothetical protein QYE76_047102 [Lolium multiflorum]
MMADASLDAPSTSITRASPRHPPRANATLATSPWPHQVTPALGRPLASTTARSTPVSPSAYKKRPNATHSPFQPLPTLTPPSLAPRRAARAAARAAVAAAARGRRRHGHRGRVEQVDAHRHDADALPSPFHRHHPLHAPNPPPYPLRRADPPRDDDDGDAPTTPVMQTSPPEEKTPCQSAARTSTRSLATPSTRLHHATPPPAAGKPPSYSFPSSPASAALTSWTRRLLAVGSRSSGCMAHAATLACMAWPTTGPGLFTFSFFPATWKTPLGRPVTMAEPMFTMSRQLGYEQPRYLFESALIKVSRAVGRLLPEVKGGQMECTKDGELSWMVVCTLRGSHVKNIEEIEVQIFDRTWEEGLVRVMQAVLAHLVFHHRVELETMGFPHAHLGRRDEEGFPTMVPYVFPLSRQAAQMEYLLYKTQLSLDSNRMENEVLKHEMEGLKLDLKLAKLKTRRQQKQKLRVREANYMLKVKVMHLKAALREAEDKLETLQDEGEDLRKEDTALISDNDDYMEDEGYNGKGLDDDEDDEDRAFINDEPEEPEPLRTVEATADDDEEDPEEPPFEDTTIVLDDF